VGAAFSLLTAPPRQHVRSAESRMSEAAAAAAASSRKRPAPGGGSTGDEEGKEPPPPPFKSTGLPVEEDLLSIDPDECEWV
jgi:hypothetical protein